MARQSKAWLFALALATCCVSGLVSAADLTAIRSSDGLDKSRLVIDLSDKPTSWSSAYNAEKQTVTLQLQGTTNGLKQPIQSNGSGHSLIKGVSLRQSGQNLIVDLEAVKSIQYNAFALSAPNRIVIDVFSPYTQKTSKELDEGISNVKWKTTVKEGPVMASVFKVQPSVGVSLYTSDAGAKIATLSANNRAAVGIRQLGKPASEPPQTVAGVTITSLNQLGASSQLVYNNRGYFINQELPNLQVKTKHWSLPITGINGPRTNNAVILYTRDYGTMTKTNDYGKEITVVNNKITAIRQGNSPIGVGEFVISAHGQAAQTMDAVRVGDSILLQTTPSLASVQQADSKIYRMGRPTLVNGRYVGSKRSGNMARSFLGTTANHELFVVTVDKTADTSVGVTSQEGAALLRKIGVVDALELTGQGSVDTAYKGKAVHGSNDRAYTRALLFVD